MTDVHDPDRSLGRSTPGFVRWLRTKDPNLLVVKRSVRAAIAMPAVFAIAHVYFSSPQVSLFAAFGSFALLLLVEFTGPVRVRFRSYLALFVVGSVFIAVGTAVSTNKVGAVIAMGVVGFAVLFAGIVAPGAATASTAALLTFVLPVAVAQPASAIGDRLLGWALAGGACITACHVLWPPPWHDDLRRRLSSTVTAVARLMRARARFDDDPGLQSAVRAELRQLRTQFSATPYPPTGAATNAVALSKLVGRVEWVAGNSALIGDEHLSKDHRQAREQAQAIAVIEAAADALDAAAPLICDAAAHPVSDPSRIEAVRDATRRLDGLVAIELASDVALVTESEAPDDDDSDAVLTRSESIAGALSRPRLSRTDARPGGGAGG